MNDLFFAAMPQLFGIEVTIQEWEWVPEEEHHWGHWLVVQWDDLAKTYGPGSQIQNPYLVGNIKNPKKIWPLKKWQNLAKPLQKHPQMLIHWPEPEMVSPARRKPKRTSEVSERSISSRSLGALIFSCQPWRWEFLVTGEWYRWWTKSCTTKDDDYPIIYRALTIPGGARLKRVYHKPLKIRQSRVFFMNPWSKARTGLNLGTFPSGILLPLGCWKPTSTSCAVLAVVGPWHIFDLTLLWKNRPNFWGSGEYFGTLLERWLTCGRRHGVLLLIDCSSSHVWSAVVRYFFLTLSWIEWSLVFFWRKTASKNLEMNM